MEENPDGVDDAHGSPYPDRPGEPDCMYYLRTGLCGYGNNCRYNHPTHIGLVSFVVGFLESVVHLGSLMNSIWLMLSHCW